MRNKSFSGLVWWILSYFTFGIYTIYVWCSMTAQHNRLALAAGEKKIMGYLAALLLGLVTFGIFPMIWTFMFCNQMAKINKARNAGVSPKNPFVMFLLCFVPIFSFFWLANAHNKLIRS